MSNEAVTDVGLIKAKLAQMISAEIAQRAITQDQAAALMGVAQSEISRVLCGNIRGFSLERLLRLVNQLGRDVEITIKRPKKRRQGRVILTLS
jgi:predicted XRE-type DNA-binding protein